MLASLFLLSTTAQGAAYYFSDIGVRAYSRGGAFVAGADDLTALYYNPAAMTRLRGITTTLSVAGVGQDIMFDRADYPGDEDNPPINYEPITNAAPAYMIPHFGISGNFGLPKTTFALGFYPPYAPDVAYPNDGSQRYSLIDTLVIQTFTGVSAAHKFTDWLSIGGGLSWNVLIVEQELKAYVPVSLPPLIESGYENPDYDVGFGVRAQDDFALTWNLGVLIEPPSQKWAFGAMYQPPIKFDGRGNLYADFSEYSFYTGDNEWDLELVNEPKPVDNDITIDVTMPPIIRTGFLIRPTSRFELEFAYVWQGWSNLKSLTVTNLDLEIETSFPDPTVISDDIVLPTGFVNAHSYRLGGQYDIQEFATIRLGVNFETSAIRPKNLAPNMVDTNKVGYGAGGSYHTDFGLSLDFGISQVFYKDTTVKNSEVFQISVDPLSGEVSDGSAIGNGKYTSRLMLLGAGFTYTFQPKK
ncbi:MAG: OmpP1/FadL family transporter [Myxococcota bacterium]